MILQLTPQQHQVVALLARGLPDKAIARELGLKLHTVKSHLQRVRDRSGCCNRVEIAVAFMRGELKPAEAQ
jgi:DNA-binding NarL/FixJ family response regulator